jgi:hypothetical protein
VPEQIGSSRSVDQFVGVLLLATTAVAVMPISSIVQSLNESFSPFKQGSEED